jgi:hypothetical protein
MEQDIQRLLEAENEDGEEIMDPDRLLDLLLHTDSMSDHEGEDDAEEDDEDDNEEENYAHMPVVHPRARFAGACNVETVKDGT